LASIDARGNFLSSGLASESQSRRHASKGASIVLIDRRPLSRECISRWIQDGSPDRHLVSVASPEDLLGGLGSAMNPDIIIFSIGAAPLSDADVSGKISLLRHRVSRIPLVLLSDRDDLDDIIEAMERMQLPCLRQTTARVGQLRVFPQASMVVRSACSIAGLSATTKRGPLSKRMHLP
jgi:hypothetical protein